ncbi:MAG: FAD:protein FMN transferase, partial [Flavobacteriales bacterium]|nr:FAD:protein FMN transferase [Flavobacteriales bacterium]
MKVISSCISVIFLTSLLFGQASFHHTEMKMGCRFDITVVAIGQEEADRFLEIALDEIDRIEKLISSWDESSQTSAINRKAGIAPVKVDRELFELIKRCIGLSELTSGAFDISYASMDKIWRYDGSMKEMPSQQEIRNSVSNVGFDKIVLDDSESTVFLPDPGMKIGFGAIGKGYAADRTKSLLKEQGVESAIVNASGDLNAWGQQANGENWKVAITNPLNKSKAFAWLPVQDRAVVTSGNYEKYV